MAGAFELQASKLENEVIKYHSDKSGWIEMKSQKGMNISYKKSPHFRGNIYKFVCEIDAPDDALYDVMKPPLRSEDRLSWDKSIKDFQCFKSISPDLMIGLIITNPVMMGLISSREFLDLYSFRQHLPSSDNEFDRVSWILAENVDHPERPIGKKFVRACNYPTGYAVCRFKEDPNKSKLFLYINVDVGGMLPQSLVEAALPGQQIAYIESVKKEVYKRLGQ